MPRGQTGDETRYPDKLLQAHRLLQLMQTECLWDAASLYLEDIKERQWLFRKVRRARSFSKLIDATDAYFKYVAGRDRKAYDRMCVHMAAYRGVLDTVRTMETRRLAELASEKAANDTKPAEPAAEPVPPAGAGSFVEQAAV